MNQIAPLLDEMKRESFLVEENITAIIKAFCSIVKINQDAIENNEIELDEIDKVKQLISNFWYQISDYIKGKYNAEEFRSLLDTTNNVPALNYEDIQLIMGYYTGHQ